MPIQSDFVVEKIEAVDHKGKSGFFSVTLCAESLNCFASDNKKELVAYKLRLVYNVRELKFFLGTRKRITKDSPDSAFQEFLGRRIIFALE